MIPIEIDGNPAAGSPPRAVQKLVWFWIFEIQITNPKFIFPQVKVLNPVFFLKDQCSTTLNFETSKPWNFELNFELWNPTCKFLMSSGRWPNVAQTYGPIPTARNAQISMFTSANIIAWTNAPLSVMTWTNGAIQTSVAIWLKYKDSSRFSWGTPFKPIHFSCGVSFIHVQWSRPGLLWCLWGPRLSLPQLASWLQGGFKSNHQQGAVWDILGWFLRVDPKKCLQIPSGVPPAPKDTWGRGGGGGPPAHSIILKVVWRIWKTKI